MNRNFRRPGRRSWPAGARRGVALVVTLIMLSIITVVTITILAIVRRDRAAVTQQANLTDARFAADAGLERAKGEMMAQIISSTNLMGFGLTVSRSIPNPPAQLFVDPRVPVFVDTNRAGTAGPLDPRFFLDLNRNSYFEDTILTNGLFLVVGDPQWIGLLQNPSLPHGPNNRFVGRYAFIILPSGKSLDLNWIHNASCEVLSPPSKPSLNFFRNQGVGPWEINLAAFLADLDPTLWGGPAYSYREVAPGVLDPRTDGFAFQDAKDILLYRYAGAMANMPSFASLHGLGTNADYFATDLIDGYAAAPAAMAIAYPATDSDRPDLPWAGADSRHHFFNPQELFDSSRVGTNFIGRLRAAGASPNLGDSYAFYQLLSQLGTDSGTDDISGKIDINYTHPASLEVTNDLVPWDSTNLSERFLVTVADRLLKEQFRDFNPGWNPNPALSITNISSVTNIPISPTNFYTPAVHRLLQEAANIFDATRTNIYPSVFRPLFTSNAFGIFITGYLNDSRRSTLPDWLAISRPYGIPLIIGAKKGYPNFNEFTLQTVVQVTRKLQFLRHDTNSPPYQTNQMYILGISNLLGVEAWNSYQAPYPRPLQLEVSDLATVKLTNTAGLPWNQSLQFAFSGTNIPAGAWRGKQFVLPIYTNMNLLPPSVYRFKDMTFEPVSGNNAFVEIGFPVPDWHLTLSNAFQYILTDNDHIVDFVLSTEFNSSLDLDDVLMSTGQQTGANGVPEDPMVSRMWDTNRLNSSTSLNAPTLGIRNQIAVCLGMTSVGDDIWRAYLDDSARGLDKNKAVRAAQQFFQLGSTQYPTEPVIMDSLVMQAPFCPTRKLVLTATWQANDPLVHYHYGDLLADPSSSTNFFVPPTAPLPTNVDVASLGRLNRRYSPWGGNPEVSELLSSTDPDACNMTIKDPGVRTSDDWDFPNGKFPNIGWLGRVHRGTPWQTIYFKSYLQEATEDVWKKQSAEYRWAPAYWYRSHPTNDLALADIFTTATDLNSTRGLLSVNQAGLPAWSAVLAGVVVLRNPLPDAKLLSISTNGPIPLEPEFILPAANDTNNPPLLARFVEGLNNYRASLPNGAFRSLAEFLQVPELTWRSPWLNLSQFQLQKGLTDTAYERLPQQILSLVKAGDSRFVVYAYGQALRPARDSIDPAQGNICTNYQVTAEVATRAVIRVEGTPDRPRPVIESFNILPPD